MAKILIMDDDPIIRSLLQQMVAGMGHQFDSSGGLREGLEKAETGDFDLILLDLEFPEGNSLEILPDLMKMSSEPQVIIITGASDNKGAEIAFNFGAWDYIKKPFLAEDVTLPLTRALEYRREKAAAKQPAILDRGGILGESPALAKVLKDTARAAVMDSSVLIMGETGTGKELFAKAIHKNSNRAQGNFVVIDCGALPETLVESVLFGHEKGAFTGASESRKGLVQQADGGTLFMDEIGELPLSIQRSFLRVLQERKVRKIGSGKEQPVDFRLVAATNRNLEEMAAEETFRSDLLFRIRGIEIDLPPLRERIDDVRDIASHKIMQLCKIYGMGAKGISTGFEVLEKYNWPGNVRELINVLEHSLANAGPDPTLFPIHLPPKYRTALIVSDNDEEPHGELPMWQSLLDDEGGFVNIQDFRYRMDDMYLRSLKMTAKGEWKTACRLSGLSKTRLYDHLKKHNITLTG